MMKVHGVCPGCQQAYEGNVNGGTQFFRCPSCGQQNQVRHFGVAGHCNHCGFVLDAHFF